MSKDIIEQIRDAKHQYFTDVALGFDPQKSIDRYTKTLDQLYRQQLEAKLLKEAEMYAPVYSEVMKKMIKQVLSHE